MCEKIPSSAATSTNETRGQKKEEGTDREEYEEEGEEGSTGHRAFLHYNQGRNRKGNRSFGTEAFNQEEKGSKASPF